MWDEHVDSTSSLLPGSWLEGGAWRDNICMVVAAGLNLSPFGTKELTAQVVHLLHLGSAASNHIVYIRQVNCSTFSDSWGCTSHDCPTWINVSRYVMSLFMGFSAFSFLRLAKALTMSQPVKACSPIRLSQTLSPNDQASLLISTNRVLFSVPHFW